MLANIEVEGRGIEWSGGEVVRLYCDFISDKEVLLATFFAIKMIKKGNPIGLSNYYAARYYKCGISKVAHYVGQHFKNKSLAEGKV